MSEGSQPSEDTIRQYRAQAWQMFEGNILSWFNNLQAEIETKQATDWKPPEEARRDAKKIEAAGRTEDALRKATGDIQKRFVILALRYCEQHMNPEMDAQPLKDMVKEFVRELHNPETREVLLLAVKQEHRDDVRDRFGEFARVLWGIIDMAQGRNTDDFWYLIQLLAREEEMTARQVAAQAQGISVEDIPDDIAE